MRFVGVVVVFDGGNLGFDTLEAFEEGVTDRLEVGFDTV
jgi:hypothetical protein